MVVVVLSNFDLSINVIANINMYIIFTINLINIPVLAKQKAALSRVGMAENFEAGRKAQFELPINIFFHFNPNSNSKF